MALRFIPTVVHGILDYATAGMLLTLPRVLGWKKEATTLLTGAGAGVLAYSLLTRYELGVVKVLPMTVHLALDALGGGLLAAAPSFFVEDEESSVKTMLMAIGVFEIGASLLTKTSPSPGAAS